MADILAEFNRIIGNGVVQNWKIVLASTVTCFALEWTSGAVAKSLFPSTPVPTGGDERRHKRKEKETRADFAIRVVAFLHATLASVLCLHAIWYAPRSVVENVYASNPQSVLIFSISTGYFFWDTLTCIFGGWGVGFIAHGISCSFVYSAALYPFLHYWGLYFLLYELSTPFLHMRWLALQFGWHKSSPTVFAIIQYTFAIAFFLVRIVAGTISSFFWWGEMLALLNGTYRAGPSAGGAIMPMHSAVVVGFYLLSNIILNGLNFFWFSQIIAAKSGKQPKVAKESGPEEDGASTTAPSTGSADGEASPKRRAKKAE